jgi:hypothetical protein
MGRQQLDDAMVFGDEVITGQKALERLDLVVGCKHAAQVSPVRDLGGRGVISIEQRN